MKAKHWKLIGIVLVIGVVACLVTYADRDEGENTSLPAAVKAAINNLYPQAVIEEAETDEEGLKVYELKLKQNGEEFEVTIAPDGTLVEFESKLAIDNLPPTVAQALAEAAEGAVIGEIDEEITYAAVVLVKLDKPQTTYEAELTKDGVEIELKLAADGTILEQKVKNDDEDDEDEDEDDDDEDDDEDEDDDDEDEDDDDDDDEDDDEQQISIDQAPAAVRATILKEAEGGTIEEIDLEDEDGQAVYEADVIINGQEVEIRVAEDGTLLSKQVEDEDDDDEGDDEEDEDDEDDDEDDEEDDD